MATASIVRIQVNKTLLLRDVKRRNCVHSHADNAKITTITATKAVSGKKNKQIMTNGIKTMAANKR